MDQYQHEFGSLSNKINGISKNISSKLFYFGLKPFIKQEVNAFQPTSLLHTISLAKLRKSKFVNLSTQFPSKLNNFYNNLSYILYNNQYKPSNTTNKAILPTASSI